MHLSNYAGLGPTRVVSFQRHVIIDWMLWSLGSGSLWRCVFCVLLGHVMVLKLLVIALRAWWWQSGIISLRSWLLLIDRTWLCGSGGCGLWKIKWSLKCFLRQLLLQLLLVRWRIYRFLIVLMSRNSRTAVPAFIKHVLLWLLLLWSSPVVKIVIWESSSCAFQGLLRVYQNFASFGLLRLFLLEIFRYESTSLVI
jgi:hypothetical protein